MKTAIRDKVFETNSSSAHSMVIAEGDAFDLTFPQEVLRRGVIDLRFPPQPSDEHVNYRYLRPENKLWYLAVWASDGKIRIPKKLSDQGQAEVDVLPHSMRKVKALKDFIRKETGCEIRLLVDAIDGQKAIELESSFDDLDTLLKDERQSTYSYSGRSAGGHQRLRRLLFSSHSFIDHDPAGHTVRAYADSDMGRVYAYPQAYRTKDLSYYYELYAADGYARYTDNQGAKFDGYVSPRRLRNLLGGQEMGKNTVVAYLSGLEVGRETDPVTSFYPGTVESNFADLAIAIYNAATNENSRWPGEPWITIAPDLPVIIRGTPGPRWSNDDHWFLHPFKITMHCNLETMHYARERMKSLLYA